MKRPSAGAAAFAAIVLVAAGAARAQTQQTILYTYAALPGGASDTCKWFDDNILTDRSIPALTRQTDLLYNRIALPFGQPVALGGTATTVQGEPLVDFHLYNKTVCTAAEAVYGPTPEPSGSPTPMPGPT
jgi:hypothetical protein